MRRWSFAKGHGTENDFVLLSDRESMLHVGPAEVRAICDRRAGVGGDGLIRAVRAKHVDGWTGDPDLWFMDYRNADGSVAEMCGNGVRVFARFLLEESLAYGPTMTVATRAGVRELAVLPDTTIRTAMGPATVSAEPVTVTTADGAEHPAVAVEVGNPHAVVFIDGPDALTSVPLHLPPRWAPEEAFPDGVNVEFVSVLAEDHIALRVFERGSGETRSCGTGAVAAAAATVARRGGTAPARLRVDVPGGTVQVDLDVEETYLTGPAVIVAHGELQLFDEPASARDEEGH